MDNVLSPEIHGLLRQAAELGPGYHGARRAASRTEREAVREQLKAFGATVPAFMDATHEWIERRAKIFEAGEYPDKGVSADEETLAGLAKNFDLPVPVLIEHADSPLELGYLTKVEAIGTELFGTVALTPEANALVERSEARALSVGLSSDLSEIVEVSLVRNPRVQSARLFTFGSLAPLTMEKPDVWRERYEKLRRDVLDDDADKQLKGLVNAGRLTPAQVPFAKAILTAEGVIEFDGESRPLRQLLIAMIERQPPHQFFGEIARQPAQDGGRQLMLPEEVAFYERHFPGVSLDSIASMRR